jgi:phosphopantothenoylcysteine synthetase/decarboxylase
MARPLATRRILITSGPTHAPIDAVRFLSNRSTGRLGACIAETALSRGAHVTFIRGPGSRRPEAPDEAARLEMRDIETVDDLAREFDTLLPAGGFDAVIHAMAVLDYVPESPSAEKTRSGLAEWTLRLVPSPKMIGRIRALSPTSTLIAFKLETGRTEAGLIEAAVKLAVSSGAALVVANDLSLITDEAHPALLVAPGGEVLARPGTREEIAGALCDWLAARRGGPDAPSGR